MELKAVILALALAGAQALDNGLGLTPPLGWNTWKTCGDEGCSHDYCDEHEVKTAAQAMQDNGMQALGYVYVNLDDCWAYSRDNVTNQLTWDTDRFPSGIPALVDWLHDRGFKFGLYTSGGDQTCSSGGRDITVPGSEGYFETDINTFADWGVDYVKLDWCGNVKHQPWKGQSYHREFGELMLNASRPMFLETVAGFWFLREEIGDYANSWRFCEDHHDAWESTLEALTCRYAQEAVKATPGEPEAWPYMDFLMSGGEGCSPYTEGETGMHCPKQSDDQYRLEFMLWSLTQSPMIVCTDVRNMTSVMQEALLNEELIKYHQDTSTPPGKLIEKETGCDHCQIWGRDVSTDSETTKMVAFVNFGSSDSADVTFTFSSMGLSENEQVHVRDLWTHEDLDDVSGPTYTVNVPPTASAILSFTVSA